MNVESVWAAMLSRLERDADQAEKALADGEVDAVDVTPWIPPEMSDALPEHLAARAAALAVRQDALVRQLTERASEARREERALGRWSPHMQRPAVYLDQST